jgi:hypothetical protein
MKKSLCIIPLLATICFPVLCGGKEVSVETRAYENAVAFLKDNEQAYITNDANARAKKPGKPAPEYVEGPSDIIWDKNLVVLARSPSQEGDKYLARLAFYVVDGSVAEDFDCAAWYRGKTHERRFLKYLRQARESYETTSPCLAPRSAEEKREPALQCHTKEGYKNFVGLYDVPETQEGDAEGEADCSHMFKPRKARTR